MQCPVGLHLPYYTYGILLLVAFAGGIWLFSSNCRALRKPLPDLIDLFLIVSISGIAGARLAYILLFPQQFKGLRDYAALHEGGLVFYGGLIAAFTALLIYLWRKKISWQSVFDCFVPSLALGHALGRVGCLVNDCCYGAPTALVKIYRLSNDPPGCFRHPTQGYEALFLVLIAMASTIILRSEKYARLAKPGILSGFYLAAYSFWRFLIEFIRDDDRGGVFTVLQLSPSQLAAIILMVIGAGMIVYCYKYPADSGDKAK